MSDTRDATRDQLRRKNERLRAAIRRFLNVQDFYLAAHPQDSKVPADWKRAYDGLRELAACSPPPNTEEKT